MASSRPPARHGRGTPCNSRPALWRSSRRPVLDVRGVSSSCSGTRSSRDPMLLTAACASDAGWRAPARPRWKMIGRRPTSRCNASIREVLVEDGDLFPHVLDDLNGVETHQPASATRRIRNRTASTLETESRTGGHLHSSATNDVARDRLWWTRTMSLPPWTRTKSGASARGAH